MNKILVLCTGNSCRSQMAEAYLRAYAGERALVKSAGIQAHGVNPKAIAVMREDGLDISNHTSNRVEEYLSTEFDYVITVCDSARDRCPVVSGKALRFHHSFPDPAKATGSDQEIMDAFRDTRNLIRDYCKSFVKAHLRLDKQ